MLVDEAVQARATRENACEALGVSARSVERWRADEVGTRKINTSTDSAQSLRLVLLNPERATKLRAKAQAMVA